MLPLMSHSINYDIIINTDPSGEPMTYELVSLRQENLTVEAAEKDLWLGREKSMSLVNAAIPGPSHRTSRSTRLASRKPFLERGLAFTGRFAGEKSLDADVLVEFAPVNTVPSANQSPVLAFYWCRVH